MRIQSSALNIAAGLGNQLVVTGLSFATRTVFISTLGIEYLGINGLFMNVLAMLSLAEAGIGSSIVYSLYKPVAEDDRVKIRQLMRLYRNAYLVIAFAVALLGLSLLPFLPVLVKDSGVEHVQAIYLLFLLNTVTPYLFTYKNSFLNVCQKGYVVTLAFSVSSVISGLLKIGILHYTRNYLLFLVIDSAVTIVTSVVLAMIVNRRYPYLKQRSEGKLDPDTRAGIVKNVKAIVLQNVGTYLVLGTENIMISTFVSLAAVGLYSNYKMLIEIGRTFINQVFSNMYHSVGNLVAVETGDRVHRVFAAAQLLSFWLYSLFAVCLYVAADPFISVWIGTDYLLQGGVLAVLLLLFYERGMRNAITTVKTTSGIFYADRLAPLVQAGIGLGVSYVLAEPLGFGITGIFLGSLAGAVAVPFWVTPYLVYRHVFRRPLLDYFRKYAAYSAAGLAAFGLVQLLCGGLATRGAADVAAKGLVAAAAVNALYFVLFRRTDEFGYLASVASTLVRKLTAMARAGRSRTMEH